MEPFERHLQAVREASAALKKARRARDRAVRKAAKTCSLRLVAKEAGISHQRVH